MIIKLRDGQDILIDSDDVERVLGHLATGCMWYYCKHKKQVIGYCNIKGGKRKFHLSRVIMNCYDPLLDVDHRQHNKFDYRKAELRICSRSDNSCNRHKKTGDFTSKYKGVHWDSKLNKWSCSIQTKTSRLYIGCFKSEIDAAKAYNRAAVNYHGEFALLNTI